MDQADITRIRHMLDAAIEGLAFVEGKSRDHLGHDRLLVLALLKDLEIIGEAATRVSPKARR